MPRSPIRALSGAKAASIESSIQRFPQCRRVSLGAQLVDELENPSNIVVNLEDLHGQGRLEVHEGSLLWRLRVPNWGSDIRQTGLDVLETHGGGGGGQGTRWCLPNQAIHAVTLFLAPILLPSSPRNAKKVEDYREKANSSTTLQRPSYSSLGPSRSRPSRRQT